MIIIAYVPENNLYKSTTVPMVPLTEVSPAITATVAPTETVQATVEPTSTIVVEKTLSELVEQYGKLK